MRLTEEYRPRSLDAVIGQPKAVALCRAHMAEGVGGKAYWFSSKKPGVGKSTLAMIMAESFADPHNIDEYAGNEITLEILKDERERRQYYPLGVLPGRAVIIDEAHTLRRQCIELLLKLTETGRIPKHTAYFFTTRRFGEDKLFDDFDDAPALLSRCQQIRLTDQGVAPAFAPRLREIVRAAGLPDGHPDKYYVSLINECDGSLRAAISEALNRARIAAAEMQVADA